MSKDSAPPQGDVVAFGRYRVLRQRREVWVDGVPLKLGGRAFDVLLALIDAGGMIVSKDELMARVWAGRIVEENSLEAQVAALRRALRADRGLILTVPGRGYVFTGGAELSDAQGMVDVPTSSLPHLESETIGRAHEVRAVGLLVMSHRLVTLTGSGGIGKTRLAIEAARTLRARLAHGVRYAECAPLSDPKLVTTAVGTACGIELAFPTPERVASAIGAKQILLVVDNCEHVVEEAARLAEALLRIAPNVRLLMTSREPLGVSGEQVFRVVPLHTPPASVVDSAKIREYGAVRLLLTRVQAHGQGYEESPASALLEAAVCRRLDGIPLAIELAAAQIANLGIEEVAKRVEDRFDLLAAKRGALSRHRTLRATIEWSHDLLSAHERVALRRLSVFAGRFSLAAAGNVLESEDLWPDHVVACLSALVAKSLVVAEFASGKPQYRLLESTRLYAQERLEEAGEASRFRDRHARYVANLFQRAHEQADQLPVGEWMEKYGHEVDNVRSALDWAFSDSGDVEVGVRLVAAAIPLWVQLSLFDECQNRVMLALAALGSEPQEETRMRLLSALGITLLAKNADANEIDGAWQGVLELAERTGNDEYQLRAIHGLWLGRLFEGEVREAESLVGRFVALAAKLRDATRLGVADRVKGNTAFFLGDFREARKRLEATIERAWPSPTVVASTHYVADHRAIATMVRCQILWIQGAHAAAAAAVENLVADVREGGHAFTQVSAIGLAACPIALLNGDVDGLSRYLSLFEETVASIGDERWNDLRLAYREALRARTGEPGGGLARSSALLRRLPDARFAFPYVVLLAELVERSAVAPPGEDCREWVRNTIDRCASQGRRWCMPELLRLAGLAAAGATEGDGSEDAETSLRRGLALAREQEALGWELRCAISLGQALRARDRDPEAREIVRAVLARFDPGENGHDIAKARDFLGREDAG